MFNSVRKVCETIFNNVRGNEGVDTSPLNDWLLEMEETFARTTSKLENVENNIQGGIRAWSNYNVSANGLRVRINEAASAPTSNLEALSLNAEQVWTLMQFSFFDLTWPKKIKPICLSGVINNDQIASIFARTDRQL